MVPNIIYERKLGGILKTERTSGDSDGARLLPIKLA